MEYTNGIFTLTKTKYENFNEYVLLKDTNRYHKVYYSSAYRRDADPYVIIKGKRYHLNEFIQVHF